MYFFENNNFVYYFLRSLAVFAAGAVVHYFPLNPGLKSGAIQRKQMSIL